MKIALVASFSARVLCETLSLKRAKKRKEGPGGTNSRNNSIGNACYAS